ncbi:putative transmembrane protein [Cryptosporidium ryanae]|uniref:putative transmembrane protein n=1 Tax=Cryptosporidium ryanae TaxID=515981 RepID=UPI00351AAC07|nr:putative transmembrane protein [Cryptosporidium ryanae]
MKFSRVVPFAFILFGFMAIILVFYVDKETILSKSNNRALLLDIDKQLNYSKCVLDFDGNIALDEFSSVYGNNSSFFDNGICLSNEQIRVFEETSNLRPRLSTNYSGYLGPWIEDGIFCNWIIQYSSVNLKYCNEESIPPVYIPIFWTSIQRNKVSIEQKNKWLKETQLFLDTLNPDLVYFTVLQDAEGLKKLKLNFNSKNNVIIFNAGGATTGFKQIPIPLIKGELKKTNFNLKKDIWVSSTIVKKRFPVRKKLFEMLEYKNITDTDLSVEKLGSKNIRTKSEVLPVEIIKKIENTTFLHYEGERFKEVIERSVFHLCPRGFGRTSFRLYETIQLGTIPIYIWEDLGWFPYDNMLSELGVILESSDIGNIPQILSDIGENEIRKKLDIISKNNYWFTYQGKCNKFARK